jgi:uncharacterized protein (TIGR02246 family)
MSAQTPDDIHRLFAEGINAGDPQAAASLFEEDAILVSDPNNIVRGRTAILDGLINLVSVKPRLTLNAARVVRNGDIALLYSDWTISATGPDGAIQTVDVRPTHVARRQSDGTWRIVIDDPSAEGPEPGEPASS